jgi:hypothetical protein
MLKRILLFAAFCLIFWVACTKEENAPAIDLQSNYYPLKVGAVLLYDVDSTAYSNFTNTSQNFKFEIKDSITNTFQDLSGNVNYRIERFKRITNSSPWFFQIVFTRSKTIRAAQEFFNNQTFIRLIFPPIKGAKWNGNSKNTIGEQVYLIEKDFSALSINGISFNSTIVVTEIEEKNLIREDVVYSTYAKSVGLVQKEVRALDKNISTGKITNGFAFTQKIKNFK